MLESKNYHFSTVHFTVNSKYLCGHKSMCFEERIYTITKLGIDLMGTKVLGSAVGHWTYLEAI